MSMTTPHLYSNVNEMVEGFMLTVVQQPQGLDKATLRSRHPRASMRPCWRVSSQYKPALPAAGMSSLSCKMRPGRKATLALPFCLRRPSGEEAMTTGGCWYAASLTQLWLTFRKPSS